MLSIHCFLVAASTLRPLIVSQASARAGIKAEAHGGGPSDQQANHANDDREDNLGEAIAFHAAEELRSDTVAKTEEEEQEEHLLQNRGDGDVELTDQYAHQQSTRYCA
ncbi:hypothetical protein G6F65_022247 [Rhizopus arrhizus]|nr:hypothetical protein G6F65_022247 [Rhizopus arrhizus]